MIRAGAQVRWTGRAARRKWRVGAVLEVRGETADVCFDGFRVLCPIAELVLVAPPPGRDVIPYEEFRTGLTFATVRAMLWSPSDDPSTWRHKRRGTVLGMWRQMKAEMYERYLGALDAGAADMRKAA